MLSVIGMLMLPVSGMFMLSAIEFIVLLLSWMLLIYKTDQRKTSCKLSIMEAKYTFM